MGFDAARGDMLTVEDLAFDRNRSSSPLRRRALDWHTPRTRRCWSSTRPCLLGLLVVLAFGVRPALRRAGSARSQAAVKSAAKELGSDAAAAPQAALKPPEPAELDPERIRTQEIFEQVTDAPEARADAELAAAAKLDSLRLA